MKITPINFYSNYQNNINPVFARQNKPASNDSFSFTGNRADEKYESAKKYAEEFKNKNKNALIIDTADIDFDKLEGIQNGIKVFEGLTMKEILFIFDNLQVISATRNCSSHCSHCYVAADYPVRENENNTNRMTFEDYSNLLEGIGELNKKIGISFLSSNKDKMLSLFQDSDCIDTYLYDKEGNKHDFIELNKIMYDITERPGLFDTSGWNPKNKNCQQFAEKLAEHYSKDENSDRLAQFNISINPFHHLNTKAVMYKKAGKNDLAELYRKAYVDRMANVLFTFTPLNKSYEFGIINRAFSNDIKEADGFQEKDLENLQLEILKSLEEKYWQDYKSSNPKIIKHEFEIDRNKSLYKYELNGISTKLEPSGRLIDLCNTLGIAAGYQEIESLPDIQKSFVSKIIDANGKVYLKYKSTVMPTDIQLNFENKNKNTKPFNPYKAGLLFKKENIDKIYKK